MAIPQNFTTLEQRVLSVTSTSSIVQFVSSGKNGNAQDLMLFNGGAKACQIALGFTATTAVQDAAAGGTTQVKLGAGAYILVRKEQQQFVAGITEGSDTTTVYCHAGFGT